MRRYRYIVFTWLGLLLSLTYSMKISAQSSAVDPMDKLGHQFQRDNLLPIQLESFDLRGQQKLRDFVDYVNIIRNKTYDEELRTQARELALSLFVDGYALPKWIDQGEIVKLQEIKTQTTFSAVGESFVKEVSFGLIGESGRIVSYKASFMLQKVRQKFGNKREKVWKVFLADIRAFDK